MRPAGLIRGGVGAYLIAHFPRVLASDPPVGLIVGQRDEHVQVGGRRECLPVVRNERPREGDDGSQNAQPPHERPTLHTLIKVH
jgi:hypothetical protein